MIDLDRENLIGLGRAAKLVPARNGRPVAASTMWRWVRDGYQGVRLEAVRKPSGEWLTTSQAVMRFLHELARKELAEGQPAEGVERLNAWGTAVLDAAGI